jgi:putative transposase
MPDHLHFFCAPAMFPPLPLQRWMSYWKSLVARQWPDQCGTVKLWQRDYWDTQLRQADSYAEKWSYVHQNPLRAGRTDDVENWPYQGELNVLTWHD